MESRRPLTGTVTLSDASAEQRRAVERLTGRPSRSGASLSVSLDEVDRLLRESGAAPGGLAEAVTRLTGPVPDRNRDQAEAAAAWTIAFEPVAELGRRRAELASWQTWLQATGVVRRLAPSPDAARTLLEQVAAVVSRLPAQGIPIGRLAAECCADAHALDDGEPVGTIVLSAARALAGLSFASGGSAESRRTAWAAVGVHLDELSSLVLSLGLSGEQRTPLGRGLALHQDSGQPAAITLRQLRSHDEPLPARTVHICENPVVVAVAADALGSACPPLVCVGGQPSAAAWLLLDLLVAGGARFRYHGDFDWGGVRIATTVRTRLNQGRERWQPWRYDRASYEAMVSAAPVTARPSRLSGDAAATPWDPGLAAAMTRYGQRIEEELSLDTLLADLVFHQESAQL
jgi:uncharacterized protein (TIGR02679 family)